MKFWLGTILIFMLAVATVPLFAAQTQEAVPKYDTANEAIFKGAVVDVHDRQCPVSGGMGSHLTLRQPDGTNIEVHLASTKFVKDFGLDFKPGDELQVTGVKVKFEGVDTIFAREIKRGNDVFVFRDKQGKAIW